MIITAWFKILLRLNIIDNSFFVCLFLYAIFRILGKVI